MEIREKKEEGAIMVIAIFCILVLVVLGTLVSMFTTIELHIARNDRFGKEAFFIADAGGTLTTRVIRDMILNEGIETSNYPGFTFDSTLLNEVMNYFEEQPDLNDRATDSPDNNPDIDTTVQGRQLGVDVDFRLRRSGPGGSLLFAMGYEGVGVDRSHGGVQTYYDLDAKSKVPGNTTAEVGAIYLYQ